MKNHPMLFPKFASDIICQYLEPNPRWAKYWRDDNILELNEIITNEREYDSITDMEINDTNMFSKYERHYDIQEDQKDASAPRNSPGNKRGMFEHKEVHMYYILKFTIKEYLYKHYSIGKLRRMEELYKMRAYAIKHGYND